MTALPVTPAISSSLLSLYRVAHTYADRCQQVVELARRYNLLVVCDDVYNLMYFPSPDQDVVSPKRLFAYDNK